VGEGWTEFAGLDNDGRPKCQGWTMQDWTLTAKMTGVDIDGTSVVQ